MRTGSAPVGAAFPAGLPLRFDAATRRHGADGCVLVGGAPRRVLRLSAAGARVVDDLVTTGASTPAAAALARTLTDAGLLHPHPGGDAGDRSTTDATVVVPVRDRPASLDRCLGALGRRLPVVVVDDGSSDAAVVARVADRHGARLVRRERSGGPGVARNAGLASVDTALVVLLDSDCVVAAEELLRLVPHLDDPLVGAVAPRIRSSRTARSWIARYGAARSPLDMGADAHAVRAGAVVSYVPTAALLVRREALGDGFDPGLRYGEDVDLVWRLGDAGWRVRYDPAIVVAHDEPDRWAGLVARRHRYGGSAAPLAARHPERLAPVVLRPWPTAVALLLLARRPRPAVAAATIVAVRGTRLGRRLRHAGAPARLGPAWTVRDAVQTLDGLGRTTTMLAAPVLAAAVVRGGRPARPARALGAVVVASALRSWWRSDRTLDPVRWTLAATADDVAYGSGVWVGALRARSARSLRPTTGRRAGRAARPAAPRPAR